jgi:hypothetical protein
MPTHNQRKMPTHNQRKMPTHNQRKMPTENSAWQNNNHAAYGGFTNRRQKWPAVRRLPKKRIN